MSVIPYVYAKVPQTEYNSFNEWIAYLVSLGTDKKFKISIGKTETLIDDLTIPENIDIGEITINGIFTGAYTLTIGTMSADPQHQCFGDDIVSVVGLRRVRPEWFGAIGGGTNDDTAGIQAAIDAQKAGGFGGIVTFSKKKYRITSTIEMFDVKGVTIVADSMGAVNLGPTEATATTSSFIFWDGTDNTKPMFYLGRCVNIRFEKLMLMGWKGSDGFPTPNANRALAGIWLDQGTGLVSFNDCIISVFGVGIRLCSAHNLDFDTPVWTPGYSAYNGFYSAAAESVGGFACDNIYIENCSLNTNDIAGLSVESAQALEIQCVKPIFSYNARAIFLGACQGLVVDNAAFLISRVGDIYVTANSSTGGVHIRDSHSEQSGFFLSIPTTGDIGPRWIIDGQGGGSIDVSAKMTLTIRESVLQDINVNGVNTGIILTSCNIVKFIRPNMILGPLLHMENTKIKYFNQHWAGFNSMIISRCDLPNRVPTLNVPLTIRNLEGTGVSPSLLLGAILDHTDTILTLTSVGIGHVVTINDLTFTGAAATSLSERKFKADGNDAADCTALTACINDVTYGVPDVTATAGATTVTLASTMSILITNPSPSIVRSADDAAGMEGTAIRGSTTEASFSTGCYINSAGAYIATETDGVVYLQTADGFKISRFTGATVGTTPTLLTVFDTVNDNFVIGQDGKGITLFSPDGNTTKTLTIADTTGNLVVSGINVGATQSVGTRDTGWVTLSGTGAKNGATVNADTITVTDGNIQALAKLVKGLTDAMIAHGLIGA